MKRFLSLALTLALFAAICLPAAWAEEAAGEMAEAEAAIAGETAGGTGLTVEDAEIPLDTSFEEAVPVEEPTPVEESASVEESEAVVESVIDADGTAVEGESDVAATEISAASTGLRLSAEAITIGVKEQYTLTALGVPDGSALPVLTWRSDNAKIAKVNAKGVVTGVKKGSTVVYASFEGGGEAACAVTVLKGPKKLNISATSLTLGGDGMTAQLSYTMPEGYASNSFTWASSNPKVATVDQNGLVTTIGAGKANITIKAYNGKGAKCKVTVLGAPTAIAYPYESLSIALGQTLRPEPDITFATKKKADAAVTFAIAPESRDSGCVTVNAATGEITGVRKGSAIVTATTYNGKTAALPVTVAAAPAGISLSQNAISLGVKNVYSGLLANLSIPNGETEVASTVFWTTSNKKIATVDAKGIITPLKKGTCVITATTVTGLQDSCKVTVYKAPSKVSLSPASGALNVGETGQYKVVFPKSAGGTVVFTTSDPSVATIDDDGVVTAIKEGSVTITVKAFNGKSATAKLTVGPASNDATLPTTEYASLDSTTTSYSENMSNAEKLEYVIYCAQNQLGRPYVYGSGYHAEDYKVGFDCSGLVYWCFQRIGVKLKDTAHKQGYDNSLPKISMGSLKRGDMVCFNTVDDGEDDLVDHTGIYLGNGKFIHASSSAKKVVVSDLSSGYYNRTFSWGRRILE